MRNLPVFGQKCPPATQDVVLNIKNRQRCIDVAMYGPANPMLPNIDYWKKIASIWGISVSEAQTMRCGNCAAFNISKQALDCIQQGIGGDDALHVQQAGRLGFCEFFKFKCASARTCSAWVVGGPIRG